MPYWSAFIASYFAWMVMELWISSRDRRRSSGISYDRGSLRVVIIAFFVGVTAAWFAAFTQAWARIQPFQFQTVVLGLVLIWAGMALRLWAVLVLGRFFRITVTVQDEHRLIGEGPYRLLRHPSYSASLITMIGIGLALGNWLSLAFLVALPLAAYSYRIFVEERALKAQFGEAFETYARARWRLIPFLL